LDQQPGAGQLLVVGWLVVLPVPVLIGVAPSWGYVIAANVLLGANQGLAWSMTVVMKIDLAGPARRGLALGLNEAAGYLGLAGAAFATGALAAIHSPRTIVWVSAAAIAGSGLVISIFFVRDTDAHVSVEHAAHAHGIQDAPHSLQWVFGNAIVRDPVLRAASHAGLVNNLNDALAWGLAPLYLAAEGADTHQIAAVAATYPVVWGAGQLITGWVSDHTGRKPLIVTGMLVQGGALALLALGRGAYGPALASAILLGAGTAMVYPTLIAAVSDRSRPLDRARTVSVYRFWRDIGFVLGALIAGIGADMVSAGAAIVIAAALTATSGVAVLATPWSGAVSSATRAPERRPLRM
jgi:MFS family permease